MRATCSEAERQRQSLCEAKRSEVCYLSARSNRFMIPHSAVLAAAIGSAYARVDGWLVGRASPKTRKHQTAFAHCPRNPSPDSAIMRSCDHRQCMIVRPSSVHDRATIVSACLIVHRHSGRQIHATCRATRTPLHLRCTATATLTHLSRSLSTLRALCVIRREGRSFAVASVSGREQSAARRNTKYLKMRH